MDLNKKEKLREYSPAIVGGVIILSVMFGLIIIVGGGDLIGSQDATGDVYLDGEPVSNATVELYNEYESVDETETNSTGSFMFESVGGDGYVSISISGEKTIDGVPYHSGDYKEIDNDMEFRFSTDDTEKFEVDGDEYAVSFAGADEGKADGKVISDIYMLQAMNTDTAGEYELVGDIDGTPTQSWYSVSRSNSTIDYSGDFDLHTIFAYPYYGIDSIESVDTNVDELSYTKEDSESVIFHHPDSIPSLMMGDTILTEDDYIDFTYTVDDDIYRGFDPIGTESSPFTGEIDGNGFEIQNIHMDRDSDTGNLRTDIDGDIREFSEVEEEKRAYGIIGYAEEAVIERVGLVDSQITAEGDVGGLVGYNNNGEIRDSYTIVDSAVNELREGYENVGGVVGTNYGTVENVHTVFNSEGTQRTVGEIAGENHGSISSAYHSTDEYDSIAIDEGQSNDVGHVSIEDLDIVLDDDGTWELVDDSHLMLRIE